MAMAACGDGAICPSEALVAISSPYNGERITNADDRDLNLEGIQIDVPVRSNLPPGSIVELEVIVEGDDNEIEKNRLAKGSDDEAAGFRVRGDDNRLEKNRIKDFGEGFD